MRKQFILGTVVAIAAAILPAVSISTASASIDYATCANLQACGGMDALVAAAQKEGTLNVITIPRSWANYGEALDLFTKAFGIKIHDDIPDGSSGQEITTITSAPKSKLPDAVDVGTTYGVNNQNLFASYKVQNWKDITPAFKDASGRWYADYTGVMAMAYDTSIPKTPTKFSDLSDPAYKGMVALSGDPTSAQAALMGVFAANAAAGGTPSNIQPGIDFFTKLKASGNFVTTIASGANLVAGAYKVGFDWSFDGPGAVASASEAGKTVKYVVPSDAVVEATPYLQAIPVSAPHPAAARLWEEFLYSENNGLTSKTIGSTKGMSGSKIFNSIMGGQNIWIEGAAIPAEYPAMQAKGTAVTPPAGYGIPAGVTPIIPTLAQQNAAIALLKTAWPAIAGN